MEPSRTIREMLGEDVGVSYVGYLNGKVKISTTWLDSAQAYEVARRLMEIAPLLDVDEHD